MGLLEAVVLGALQGATEFLPISSSAHLIVVPAALGWHAPLSFDVAVHIATGLAVLAYFRADWMRLLAGAWRGVRAGDPWGDADARTLALIVLASIPVAVAGLGFRSYYAGLLAGDLSAMARESGAQLIVNGLLLVAAEPIAAAVARRRAGAASTPHGRAAGGADNGAGDRGRGAAPADGSTSHHDALGLGQSLAIGVAQAVSLLPGISRSGATIAVGQVTGLTRERAARFSFLLGTPAILGAGVVEALERASGPAAPGEVVALAAGFVAAFAVGWASIDWLLGYLRRAPMYAFAVYCWVVGLAAMAWFR